MNKATLKRLIQDKKSFLCVGLDPDWDKLPDKIRKEPEPILSFNKAIIDATVDYAVAYKPNMAFYEALGSKGWDILYETLAYIPEGIFTIADAKRGDIGNTADQYAKAFFDELDFDAVTLSPYMGRDAIEPFLTHENKWAIILALTSNPGANDFQLLNSGDKPLYAHIMEKAKDWGNAENTMFVFGGTQASYLKNAREYCPDHFLLIPGIGKQGGDLEQVAEFGMNKDYGILVNVSRSILYAGTDKDFKKQAREAAHGYQKVMRNWV